MMSKRILVVDDERELAEILGQQLQMMGCEVFIASDVESALDLLKREPVDAVITDVQMPGRTGFELMSEIHKNEPELPVYLMTGFSTVSDEEAQKKGARRLFRKPLNAREMISIVANTLDQEAS